MISTDHHTTRHGGRSGSGSAGAIIFGTNVMPGMGTVSLLDDEGNRQTDRHVVPQLATPGTSNHVPGSSSAGGCAAVAGADCCRSPSGATEVDRHVCRLPGPAYWVCTPRWVAIPIDEPASQAWNTSLGPLTRDARDGALVMQAISGPDGGTVLSIQSPRPGLRRRARCRGRWAAVRMERGLRIHRSVRGRRERTGSGRHS